MLYDYSLDLNSRRVTVTFQADAEISDVLDMISRLEADENFAPGFGLVIDARGMNFLPSPDESVKIAALFGDKDRFDRNPTAVLVSSPAQFGLSNVVKKRAGRDGIAIHPFYDLADALEWLRARQAGALQ